MKPQLIAACVTSHTATEKHPKGKKTRTVNFININLIYPENRDTMNFTYKPKKRPYENSKPASKREYGGHGHTHHSGNLQRGSNAMLQLK